MAVANAMEMRAGLRWPAGRERSRVRRAVPRLQAVSVVKLRKVYSSLVSWAIRTAGWSGWFRVSLRALGVLGLEVRGGLRLC